MYGNPTVNWLSSCSTYAMQKSLLRHQALEFLEPVLDDDDFPASGGFFRLIASLDHQEPLPVGVNVVVSVSTLSWRVQAIRQRTGSILATKMKPKVRVDVVAFQDIVALKEDTVTANILDCQTPY